ncbi:hypothetical protein [Thermincola potens]|uniref:Uncharacterized protein n=1 Tax=Thermincola potens (strain JR) TaxID=635013 RepID=D5XAI2_THEPJ|nr:hypothetical protein [Thermincola potens]ADG81281.1 conserved hypothetical protein [Thermincola potens JR]
MGKYGQIMLTSFAALACLFIAMWIGNPIKTIHYVLIIGALILGSTATVLYFGWLQKTEEKIVIAIVIILTFFFVTARRYLF